MGRVFLRQVTKEISVDSSEDYYRCRLPLPPKNRNTAVCFDEITNVGGYVQPVHVSPRDWAATNKDSSTKLLLSSRVTVSDRSSRTDCISMEKESSEQHTAVDADSTRPVLPTPKTLYNMCLSYLFRRKSTSFIGVASLELTLFIMR